MLQRAASNAYSWWWASHIRTKQSKWLEQNLQDMEDKVNDMLNIIENDGDTFQQRAEMYYRKRPELVVQVEESFRSYRALAEKYDHLSRQLQGANRTIASIFPERVHCPIDEEDDDNIEETSPQKPISFNEDLLEIAPKNRGNNIPIVPKFPKKDFRVPSIARRAPAPAPPPTIKRYTSSARSIMAIVQSGISKTEAIEEIDKLQKEILARQTEKEFVKSGYDLGYEKLWEIEYDMTDMQKRVCRLQDEFGISTIIEDGEGRALMAETALKACKESLTKLQKTQERSAEEATVETLMVKEVIKKFQALKDELYSKQKKGTCQNEHIDHGPKPENVPEGDTGMLREKIEENLEIDTNELLSVMELAEKIDVLVNMVVSLETKVSSQAALVNRLKSETDDLRAHVHSLEEDKEGLMENSDHMNNKLKEMEEEFVKVRSLNQRVENKNDSLQIHFTEASCNLNYLSVKLRSGKMDVTEENTEPVEKFESDKPEMENEGKEDDNTKMEDRHKEEEQEQEKENELDPTNDSDLQVGSEKGGGEDRNKMSLRNLFIRGLEDREKLLLEEYTTVLKDYKEVRNKLSEVEKKNKDGIFELAMQMRELKEALSKKDEEIKFLHLKVSSPHSHSHSLSDSQTVIHIKEHHHDQSSNYSHVSDLSVSDRNRTDKIVSPIEKRFRSDIDELLEESLEFWLRFSTSVHQIQKFQSSIGDLQAELLKLQQDNFNNNKKQVSLQSDTRPIYRHLREIQTELSLWLEHNAILKDELGSRSSNLCNFQDEILILLKTGEIGEYEAAKLQGEVMNMMQENKKIVNELELGLSKARGFKVQVVKTLERLDEELEILASKRKKSSGGNYGSHGNEREAIRNSGSKVRIPLRAFLFGIKLKKQKPSIFSCGNPSLQKQYSDLAYGVPVKY